MSALLELVRELEEAGQDLRRKPAPRSKFRPELYEIVKEEYEAIKQLRQKKVPLRVIAEMIERVYRVRTPVTTLRHVLSVVEKEIQDVEE